MGLYSAAAIEGFEAQASIIATNQKNIQTLTQSELEQIQGNYQSTEKAAEATLQSGLKQARQETVAAATAAVQVGTAGLAIGGDVGAEKGFSKQRAEITSLQSLLPHEGPVAGTGTTTLAGSDMKSYQDALLNGVGVDHTGAVLDKNKNYTVNKDGKLAPTTDANLGQSLKNIRASEGFDETKYTTKLNKMIGQREQSFHNSVEVMRRRLGTAHQGVNSAAQSVQSGLNQGVIAGKTAYDKEKDLEQAAQNSRDKAAQNLQSGIDVARQSMSEAVQNFSNAQSNLARG